MPRARQTVNHKGDISVKISIDGGTNLKRRKVRNEISIDCQHVIYHLNIVRRH